MKLIVNKNIEKLVTTYTIEITHADMMNALITHTDMILFEDCESEDATISDKLLALETLARRIEEGSR